MSPQTLGTGIEQRTAQFFQLLVFVFGRVQYEAELVHVRFACLVGMAWAAIGLTVGLDQGHHPLEPIGIKKNLGDEMASVIKNERAN